jgi:hypothetical protein
VRIANDRARDCVQGSPNPTRAFAFIGELASLSWQTSSARCKQAAK